MTMQATKPLWCFEVPLLFVWGIVFFLLPNRSSCQKQHTSWLVWLWLHHFLALMFS